MHIHVAVGTIALHQPAERNVDGLVEVVSNVYQIRIERANHTGAHHRAVGPVEQTPSRYPLDKKWQI